MNWTLRPTENFDKRFLELDFEERKQVAKALRLMAQDLRHASLRTKKMQGHPGIWESSANMDIRITWEMEKPDVIILRNVGHHDDTLRRP